MNNNYAFYNWFQKIISICIDIFFVVATIATLFVFTSVFNGTIKYVVFVAILLVYCAVIYFFKDKVKEIIIGILNRVKKLDTKTMLIIITLVMVVLKIVYMILFNFDATQDGDIKIYNEIANEIVANGIFKSLEISHLFGVAIHLAVFKILNIPLQIGMFVPFYLGTIINFYSFKELIGKEKTFILVLIYVLMPSSIMLTFCPTHEVFVYLYLSFSMFVLNSLIKENKIALSILLTMLFSLGVVLTCLVNPAGYIIYIIALLLIVFSNIRLFTKALLIVSMLVSFVTTNYIDNSIRYNDYYTSLNTYNILIHGSNPESLGEQVDGYPNKVIKEYLNSNDIDITVDNILEGAKKVIINQYIYLLTNPLVLIKLVAHKLYILWSGNHYSIELAHYYHAINDLTFYAMLIVSTLMYLFMLTIGLVFYKKKDNTLIEISNFELALLGVFGVTMLSVVLNKYTVYVTLFMYFLSFHRAELDK